MSHSRCGGPNSSAFHQSGQRSAISRTIDLASAFVWVSGTPSALAISSSQRAGAVAAAASSSAAPVRCSSTSMTVIVARVAQRSAARRIRRAQIARTRRRSAAACGISVGMTFEQALKDGDLDVARAILDELVDLPGHGRALDA